MVTRKKQMSILFCRQKKESNSNETVIFPFSLLEAPGERTQIMFVQEGFCCVPCVLVAALQILSHRGGLGLRVCFCSIVLNDLPSKSFA